MADSPEALERVGSGSEPATVRPERRAALGVADGRQVDVRNSGEVWRTHTEVEFGTPILLLRPTPDRWGELRLHLVEQLLVVH